MKARISKEDFNLKYEQLNGLRTAQDCTERTSLAGVEEWERLDKLINEQEQELNKVCFHGVVIRLVGELDFELTRLGLKPGDVIRDGRLDLMNNSVSFDCSHVIINHCVVWEDNYEIVHTR